MTEGARGVSCSDRRPDIRRRCVRPVGNRDGDESGGRLPGSRFIRRRPLLSRGYYGKINMLVCVLVLNAAPGWLQVAVVTWPSAVPKPGVGTAGEEDIAWIHGSVLRWSSCALYQPQP